MRIWKFAFIMFALAIYMPTYAMAKTYKLTISSSHSNKIPWVAPLSSVIVAKTNKRLEAMGSKNRVKWTEAYGGSLYGFSDTLEAVGDGITDMGWVGTLWEEAKMPYQNVTYYTPFVTDDVKLLLSTFNKMHAKLDYMKKAWEDHNVIFLGATGADTYHLFTTFPVKTLADLKGRKILAPGPSGAWISAVGAVPVNGALTTYYNQIQTGVAEGTLSIMTGVYPFKIYETTPYVTLVSIGANMVGGFAVNKDTWNKLPEDIRKVLTELGKEYSEDNAKRVEGFYQVALKAMKANKSLTITTLPEAERKKWADTLPDLAGKWAKERKHGKEVIKTYVDAIKKAGGKPLRDWTRK